MKKRVICLLCLASLFVWLFLACGKPIDVPQNTHDLRDSYWKAVEFRAEGTGMDEFWADLFLWADGSGYFRFSQATQESGFWGFRDMLDCGWALDGEALALSKPESPSAVVYTGTYEQDRLEISYDGFFDEGMIIVMERGEMPPYGAQWELPELYGTWRMAPEAGHESEITIRHQAFGADYWRLDGNFVTMEHELRVERKEGAGWEGCENQAWHVALGGNSDPAQRFYAAITGDKLLLRIERDADYDEDFTLEYQRADVIPQHNPRAWEGTWNRVGAETDTAEITIVNAAEDAFDFLFQGLHINPYGAAHIGELEETAYFTAENKAVLEYEDEYSGETITFGFVMHGDKLLVSASENVQGLFGANVYIDGVYKKI